MATKIQFRRDTAANWTSANPILSEAELGYEKDTGKFKLGDGITAWNDQSYFSSGALSVNGLSPDETGNITIETGGMQREVKVVNAPSNPGAPTTYSLIDGDENKFLRIQNNSIVEVVITDSLFPTGTELLIMFTGSQASANINISGGSFLYINGVYHGNNGTMFVPPYMTAFPRTPITLLKVDTGGWIAKYTFDSDSNHTVKEITNGLTIYLDDIGVTWVRRDPAITSVNLDDDGMDWSLIPAGYSWKFLDVTPAESVDWTLNLTNGAGPTFHPSYSHNYTIDRSNDFNTFDMVELVWDGTQLRVTRHNYLNYMKGKLSWDQIDSTYLTYHSPMTKAITECLVSAYPVLVTQYSKAMLEVGDVFEHALGEIDPGTGLVQRYKVVAPPVENNDNVYYDYVIGRDVAGNGLPINEVYKDIIDSVVQGWQYGDPDRDNGDGTFRMPIVWVYIAKKIYNDSDFYMKGIYMDYTVIPTTEELTVTRYDVYDNPDPLAQAEAWAANYNLTNMWKRQNGWGNFPDTVDGKPKRYTVTKAQWEALQSGLTGSYTIGGTSVTLVNGIITGVA